MYFQYVLNWNKPGTDLEQPGTDLEQVGTELEQTVLGTPHPILGHPKHSRPLHIPNYGLSRLGVKLVVGCVLVICLALLSVCCTLTGAVINPSVST